MQPSSATPFAGIITTLAALHRDQHQAMLDLRTDQERRFAAIVQGQQEDRERFRSWLDREARTEAAGQDSAPVHVPLHKMGPQDDPEAFIELFQKSAEACGWPRAQWPVRLIPLLSGEAQAAAQQLPVANLLDYDDLKRAIIQRVGRTPEQHRQHFRSLEWSETGRPFAMAQQLRDSCHKWLLAGGGDVDHIIDLVVLEQFVARLPKKTAEWVQCHRPTSLEINLAEDHMVACPGVGEPPLTFTSLSPPSVSLSLPSSRPPGPPRIPPRGRGGMRPGPFGSSRALPRGAGLMGAGGDNGSSSTPSPRPFSNPLPATGAAGKPALACWRCGDPDNFVDRCPRMDIGTMIRVPDVQRTTPDQAGDRVVKVRCVHGDVVEYPVVPITIQFRGEKHNVEVAVSPHLRHPLILGTNWPAFSALLGSLCADAAWEKKARRGAVRVQLGETETGPLGTASEETSGIERLILSDRDDFPLEQSQDETLKNAFQQVRTIDGQSLQPALPVTYPYFAIIKDRLYQVTQDTQTKVRKNDLG
ncbi:uncharacterized protein [Pseudorasbora parva]|uniref:uncharacterized protein n=1 Tax=Pseudorasbora parva TaxID=51549 RepID=UPI00351E0703